MNEITTLPAQVPARREMVAVLDAVPIFDTAQFEHFNRIATAMARSTVLPAHLKVVTEDQFDLAGTVGNCLAVVNQARSWAMDPYAVAQCMSFVHGRPCYEGKLIAAVIETKAGVRLKYTWTGEPTDPSFKIRIENPDSPDEWVEGTVAAWKTNQWGTNPSEYRKRLKYRGDREWCRMWRPALMLGVYTDDELDDLREDARARRATPVGSGLISRLPAQGSGAEGFTHDHAKRELSGNSDGGGDVKTVVQASDSESDGHNRSEQGREPAHETRTAETTPANNGQPGETPGTKSDTEVQPETTAKGTSSGSSGDEPRASGKATRSRAAGAAKADASQPPQESETRAERPAEDDGSAAHPSASSNSAGESATEEGGGAGLPGTGAASEVRYPFKNYSDAILKATTEKSLREFARKFRDANAWTTEDDVKETLQKIYAIHKQRVDRSLDMKELAAELAQFGAA